MDPRYERIVRGIESKLKRIDEFGQRDRVIILAMAGVMNQRGVLFRALPRRPRAGVARGIAGRKAWKNVDVFGAFRSARIGTATDFPAEAEELRKLRSGELRSGRPRQRNEP